MVYLNKLTFRVREFFRHHLGCRHVGADSNTKFNFDPNRKLRSMLYKSTADDNNVVYVGGFRSTPFEPGSWVTPDSSSQSWCWLELRNADRQRQS